MHRSLPFAALVLLASVAGPAAAADNGVDLALVLAVDVSRSMDLDEQQLQRQGYANAFRHPEVLEAIADGARGKIAVTYVEWAGPSLQVVAVPWQVIGSPADATAFADKIAATPLETYMRTSISGGLAFAAAQFGISGVQADRETIDVSGDGPNNAGPPVDQARDLLVRQGITINGLPIMLKAGSGGFLNLPNLDLYYRDCVIGGPGAFMLTVDDQNGFETAIRRKLVLEISGVPPRLMPAADIAPAATPTDCQIGEKAWKGLYLDH